MALDPNQEAFVGYIAIVTLKLNIHSSHQAQIVLLKTKKVSVIIPAEYSNFANIFPEKLIVVLSKHIEIITHTINPKEDKQPPYRSIYSLRLVELEILKTYIKINLANILSLFLSPPLALQFYLTKNLIEVFDFVSIIKALITSLLKIGFYFHSLVNILIE